MFENSFTSVAPLGDSAIVVQFDNTISLEMNNIVNRFAYYLERHPFQGMREVVPAFTTVTVFYDPMIILYPEVCDYLLNASGQIADLPDTGQRTVEIPVCYGGDFGPDLEFVANYNLLPPEEVIAVHSGTLYHVYMMGFAPGFAYLGGLSEKIGAPRRSSPRLSIPAGSVGIAGKQTGVYPISTPGGWQIIGRTPIELFRPEKNPPTLLQAGDSIRFKSISFEEFHFLKEASL